VALRQAFLSLLTSAIRQSPRRQVALQVRLREQHVEIWMQAAELSPGPPQGEEEAKAAASVEMARHLVEACRGELVIGTGNRSFTATVRLQALEQLPVLLLDDHSGTRDLLQRYASGTRYCLYGAANLDEALSLAAQFPPRIIVLDVMMPDVDGWEVLGRLRHHPLTAHAQIIVCTILAEEELALSLGASSYVRKPVSRQDFLGSLDAVASAAPPCSA